MANHIPGLPVELISRILQHVSSRTTLLNAALCSRTWHEITVPHLYNSVDIGRDDPTIRPALQLFLRNPDFAKYVRHLAVIHAWEDCSYRDWDAEPKPLGEALEAAKDVPETIKSAIKNYCHTDGEHAKWLQHSHVEDANLALLLPQLKNVETLCLQVPIMPHFVRRILHRIAMKEKPFDTDERVFDRLHSVVWAHNDNKYGGPFTAAPFLIPSVKNIYLHRMGSDDGDEANQEWKSVANGVSNCTHLELKDCRYNHRDIEKLIRVPKQLRTFIYEIGWGHLSYCSVSFTALRSALEAHRDSLQDLWIDYGHDGINWLGELDELAPMKSLRDFKNLRRLRIAPDFVLGVRNEGEEGEEDRNRESKMQARLLDFLPKGLERLHITHSDAFGETLDGSPSPSSIPVLYKAIEYMLAHQPSHVPSLQKLVFDSSLPRITEDRERIAGIVQLADSAGVNMIVRNNHGHRQYKDYDARVERMWGFDEDVPWAECDSRCNKVPVYEVVDVQH